MDNVIHSQLVLSVAQQRWRVFVALRVKHGCLLKKRRRLESPVSNLGVVLFLCVDSGVRRPGDKSDASSSRLFEVSSEEQCAERHVLDSAESYLLSRRPSQICYICCGPSPWSGTLCG